MPEIREHPTLEGYGASADGRVWSRWKMGPGGGLGDTWKERKQPSPNKSGHLLLSLCGGRSAVQIHRFVLECFEGPCPEGMQCRHLDGDPTNNTLSNLKWGTPKENMRDRDLHGTTARGSRNGNSKLSESDVLAIRASTEGLRPLARKFGVSKTTIVNIRLGRTWV